MLLLLLLAPMVVDLISLSFPGDYASKTRWLKGILLVLDLHKEAVRLEISTKLTALGHFSSTYVLRTKKIYGVAKEGVENWSNCFCTYRSLFGKSLETEASLFPFMMPPPILTLVPNAGEQGVK